MGSPLGPLFANIFMDEFEHKHMDKLKELGVATWMRYVDDIFSLIRDRTCLENILKFINEQHPNIKFTTTEGEIDNRIPFLDTCVTRKSNGFSTKLYHKPTFTGVYLNWTSLTSRKYKISLIYCLSDRIWKICTKTTTATKRKTKKVHCLTIQQSQSRRIRWEVNKTSKRQLRTSRLKNSLQSAT